MKSLKKLIPVAFILLSLAACSKSKETVPKDTTVALLESSDWRITTLTVVPAQNGVTDILASLPPCLLDNFFQFKAGGIFNSDQGAIKCSPTFPQVDVGTWSYSESLKLLSFNSMGWPDRKLHITSITNNTISGTDDRVENGLAYVYYVTFTKK